VHVAHEAVDRKHISASQRTVLDVVEESTTPAEPVRDHRWYQKPISGQGGDVLGFVGPGVVEVQEEVALSEERGVSSDDPPEEERVADGLHDKDITRSELPACGAQQLEIYRRVLGHLPRVTCTRGVVAGSQAPLSANGDPVSVAGPALRYLVSSSQEADTPRQLAELSVATASLEWNMSGAGWGPPAGLHCHPGPAIRATVVDRRRS
jgi:hypothetical protein